MPTAKDIHVAPITARDANRLIKRLHYSGKIVMNSQLHLGAFLNGRLEGAMSFGPSLDKRKIQGLVADSGWNDFLELNRMAFSEALPRNSESRALSVSFKLLRKHYPHLKWVISFADATQCGDGTIYRAAGFILTAIKKNSEIWRLSDGRIVHAHTLDETNFPGQRTEERVASRHAQLTRGASSPRRYVEALGLKYERLPGYQFRYIYFLDPTYRERLTVPEIPYSDIPPECRMYKGQRLTE